MVKIILTGPLSILIFLTGCAGPFEQVKFSVSNYYCSPLFTAESFKRTKVGFITPSAATTHSEDKLMLANILAESLRQTDREIDIIPPSQCLTIINQAGLNQKYTKMLEGYQGTGIMDRDTLGEIGQALNARYLIHLKLASFIQRASARLSAFGLRAIDTRESSIRISIQIWDAPSGSILWDSSVEGVMAIEEFRARDIPFNRIAKEVCQKLAEELLKGRDQSSSQSPPGSALRGCPAPLG